LTFGKFAIEQATYEFGVTHLGRKTCKRSGDLRIEEGCDRADDRREHFEVLSAGMQNFDRPSGTESGTQGTKITECERIHADGLAGGGKLEQAQFGSISAFAEEFGVERERLAVESTGEVFEGRRALDECGGRRHDPTMQEFGPKGNGRS
jgi:hypothetical protein